MMKTIGKVLMAHKAFMTICLVMLAVMLARIPLGDFNSRSPLDTLAHLVFPAVTAPLAYVLMVEMGFLPRLRVGAVLLMIFMLGVSFEAMWEVVEFCVDSIIGTHWQIDNTDTMTDIIMAVVGSLVGAGIFVKFYDKK